MGVKLADLVESREIRIGDLAGRTILFDAFNMLYQFLTTIRAADGTLLKAPDGRVTSHLVGLVNRLTVFLEEDLLPVLVFDGESPALKTAERERRAQVKAEAAERLREALRSEDDEAVRKYAARTAHLDERMIADAKRLLDLLGVPWLDAPSEAEAEAAFLVRQGRGWAVASEDYDSLVFGAERLVRHLAVGGQRRYGRTMTPEIILLEDVLSLWNLSHEDMIIVAILVGTDFNPGGVRGIGVKRALDLVREYRPDYEALFRAVDWPFAFSWREVFRIFAEPRVIDAGPFRLGRLDRAGMRAFLLDELGFAEDRVNRLLERLMQARDRGRQSSLAGFFQKKK